MDLSKTYGLSPQAVIRPERFGGLVYRYDNRRLYFLHSHALVDFVSHLDGSRPLQEALDAFLSERKLPEKAKQIYTNALIQLEKLEVLREL